MSRHPPTGNPPFGGKLNFGKPTTYEVRVGTTWVKCKKARLQPRSGWLHYELHDGTVGLSKPGSFRVVERS